MVVIAHGNYLNALFFIALMLLNSSGTFRKELLYKPIGPHTFYEKLNKKARKKELRIRRKKFRHLRAQAHPDDK